MAWVRLSPGRYKNSETGEVRNSATKPTDGAAPAPAAPVAGVAPGMTGLSPALQKAQSDLAAQVAVGGINQAQADAELNHLRGMESTTAPTYNALPFETPTDLINTTGQVAKGQQIAGNTLTNANQYNPFGEQTVTFDPITGQPTVKQGLSNTNQQVVGGIQQGGIDANQVLSQMFKGGVLGSLNNPSSAGGPAPTSNYEDAVFKRLTSGYDKDRTRDRAQLEQTLANRGIPLGSALYNDQVGQLEKRYDDMFSNAKAQAVETGTNSSLSAIPTLAGVGQGAFMNPTFQQFQANPYQQTDLNSLYNTVTQQGLTQQQIDIQKQNAAKVGGGGGGGGGSANNPFNNSLPPYAR